MDEKLERIVNSYLEKLKGVVGIGWVLIHPHGRSIVEAYVKHQQEVLQVMSVLPGKHRYEQVEAAINASGTYPRDIYMSLAANERTIALARFYEALNGPDGVKL